ncbi:hypothetical protein ACOMHN_040526 [Nucella lapillus]
MCVINLEPEMTSHVCNVTELAANGNRSNVTMHYEPAPEYAVYFTYIYRVIYAVGLVGNVCALVVWARSGLRSSPVTYFQAICVADSLVLVMHPLETLPDFVHVRGVCQMVHVLFLAVQVFAILLVLGLTVERYIELCHPMAADHFISYKRTVRCILLLACLSLLFSLCEAYIWNVPEGLTRCQLRHTISRRFMWTYAILVLVVLFLCPLMLVVLFNVLVARRIRHRRKNSLAFSVAMVPDKHNMNLSVTFVSLYLAVCEIVYAAVHSSQYFVSERQLSTTGADSLLLSSSSSAVAATGTGTAVYTSGGNNGGGMPLTGRWHSFYINSLPLYIADVLALTSYAVDLTIFTLCSRTFRRNMARLFRRYQRRKSVVRGYRLPAAQALTEHQHRHV